jgi:hypothetical protein
MKIKDFISFVMNTYKNFDGEVEASSDIIL